MPAPVASRPDETRAVADFLTAAAIEPAALVMEGEPGIGKTTLWLHAVDEARERGFRVLLARSAAAESVLAYATLADLLGGVDGSVWADLPEPQRIAMDRVLLRAENDDAATDLRAVAAGFLSAVEGLVESTPVLLAIDDLQWIDPSSAHVLAFAARRLSAHVGVLATVRTGADHTGRGPPDSSASTDRRSVVCGSVRAAGAVVFAARDGADPRDLRGEPVLCHRARASDGR
jgi:hypothetical protein